MRTLSSYLILILFCLNAVACRKPQEPLQNNYRYITQVDGATSIAVTGSEFQVTTDNCGSQASTVESFKRARTFEIAITLEVTEEVRGKIGADLVAGAEIEAAIGSSLGLQIGEKETVEGGRELETPANSKTITTLQWEEIWQTGKVFIERDDRSAIGNIPFRVLTTMRLSQTGVRYLPCAQDGVNQSLNENVALITPATPAANASATALPPTITPTPLVIPTPTINANTSTAVSQSLPSLSTITEDNAHLIKHLAFWEEPSNNGTAIQAMAFSPDGKLLAVGTWGGIIFIYDIQQSDLIYTLNHHCSVQQLLFSPNSEFLVSAPGGRVTTLDGGWCEYIRLWQVDTGELYQYLEHPTGWDELKVAFSPNGLTLASAASDVKFWEMPNGVLLNTVDDDRFQMIKSLAFTPNGTELVTGFLDGTFGIWNWQSGRLLEIIDGRQWNIQEVSFSPNGSYLATAGSDSSRNPPLTVLIWDYLARNQLFMLEHNDTINSISFSADGSLLATAEEYGPIRLWRMSDGRQVKVINEESRSTHPIAFSPDGKLLAIATHNGISWYGVQE